MKSSQPGNKVDYSVNTVHKKKIAEFLTFLKKVWKDSKPLAKLFKTEANYYIYDTGTNKIMRCEPSIYDLLNLLFSMSTEEAIKKYLSQQDMDGFVFASGSIKSVIESQNVLLTTKVEKFGAFDTFEEYEALIRSSLEILCLETTDSCNLRCGYCVYSDHVHFKRNHGKRSMTWDVAQRSIDYLKENSINSKKNALSFYGGEPVINFSLVTKAASYAKSIFEKKQLSFSITTNGTLLTPTIAQFLYDHNFQVLISIDGPKEIHDRYRKDIEGKGSFERAVQGLRFLIDAYGDSVLDKIQLSMVYTPPWSGRKLDRIMGMWEEIPWIPRKMKVNITYPVPGSTLPKKLTPNQLYEDRNLLLWSFDNFKDKFKDLGDSNPIANFVIERKIADLMQRPVYPEPIVQYSLNGCCIPGVRKLFVTVDGIFRLCERIHSDSPPIGNINKGIDLEIIKKIYLDGYVEAITPICSECWAIGLCKSCYIDVLVGGKIDVNARENICQIEKQSLDHLLSYYCSLLETDPQKLRYLYDFGLI